MGLGRSGNDGGIEIHMDAQMAFIIKQGEEGMSYQAAGKGF